MKRKTLTSLNMTLEKAYEDFEEFNNAKNLSANSMRYYDDCFKYFR